MNVLRKEYKRLFWAPLSLVVLGLVVLFSVYSDLNLTIDVYLKNIFIQSIAIILGLIVYFTFPFLSVRIIKKSIPFFFFLSFLSVLALKVPGWGIEVNGAVRWLNLGIVTVQPSEFFSLVTVMMMAYIVSIKKKDWNKKATLLTLFLFLAVSSVIFIQSKYALAIIFASVFISLLLIRRIPVKYLILLFVMTVILFGVLYSNVSYIQDRFLSSKDRLSSIIFDTEIEKVDLLGRGYHQDKLIETIASGQLIGRGLGQGKNKSTVLPEAATDSIFAVAAEEFGFVGSSIILFLFFIIIRAGFIIANHQKTLFRVLLASSITIYIGSQVIFSLSYLFYLPFSGIPFLLFSKGGSSIIATLTGIGILKLLAKDKRS